jgi:hypothetical protein
MIRSDIEVCAKSSKAAVTAEAEEESRHIPSDAISFAAAVWRDDRN